VEGWRVRRDGTRFWASAVLEPIKSPEGEVIGFATITRDITDKRAAEETLRQSERQFRLLVNNVTDYALYMIDLNGTVTSWNAGAEKIKGYTGAEIIGQHFSKFYTEVDRAAGMPLRSLTTAMSEGQFEAEGLRVRKDGSVFWAHVIIDAVRDEKGDLVGFAKITRDVTERRENQKKLQDAQRQLAHAQKMDALGQLTGGVAHDFNNLLMIISGQIRKIKKYVPDHELLARSAHHIEDAVQRGSALTRQLLTFSRRQSLTPTVMAPSEVLKGINAMLESSIGGTVDLVTSTPPEIWPILVDRNELELALVNIVVNARDAMPQGGTITISVENTYFHLDQDNRQISGEFVRLTIADTGMGIPPDLLTKIFEPFFTTKSLGKGTGLGLSQAQGFVHQSGGDLMITSELGKGTQVRMYFPRARAEPVQLAPAAPDPGRYNGVALLVDDNGPVLEVTKSMLEDIGFRVRTALDAQQALAAMSEQKFDLILSDIVMAGPMNGLALARTIRKEHPKLPIILATGYSDTVPEALVDFPVLRKPFHISELSKAVAAAAKDAPDNLVAFRKKA
jgi:PAS domain S-box-containing protein